MVLLYLTNKFNSYFTDVAFELNKNIAKSNNVFQDYLKTPNEHSFYVNETNPHEISLIIDDLKILMLLIFMILPLNLLT